MKNTKLNILSLSVIGLGCLSFLVAGCDKRPASDITPTTPAAVSTAEPTAPAADISKPAGDVNAAVAAVATDATNAASAVVAAGQTAVASTTDQVNAIIAKVQSLVTSNNLSEASSQLQNLTSLQLTPAQQQLVDDLKQQIQRAMTAATPDAAAKTLGGLTGK